MFQFIGRLFYLAAWLIACNALVSSSQDWHFAGPNVALGKHAEQYPGNFANLRAELAVDGITTATGDNRYCSHTGEVLEGDNAWWRVGLGDYYKITGIRIYNKDLSNRERLKGFHIHGHSHNGDTRIYTSHGRDYYNNIINVALDRMTPYNSVNISLPTANTYRYTGTDIYLTLCEVEVYALGCPMIHVDQNSHFKATVIHSNFPVYNDGHESYNAIDTVIGFTCMEGYSPTQQFSIQCMANGSYNKTSPFCIQNYCTVPKAFDHGHYTPIQQSHYAINMWISAHCNPGYDLHGAPMRTCEKGGNWSGQNPSCVIVNCITPAINNGHFVNSNVIFSPGTSVPFQTVLQTKCLEGYHVVVANIHCRSDKLWNESGPFCKVFKTCGEPSQISSGHYTYANGSAVGTVSSFPYGSIISVKCHKGFSLNGMSSNITCSSEGNWSLIPTCKIIKCMLPIFINGYYELEGGDNTAKGPLFEDMVIPKCVNELFKLVNTGDGRRMCLANGRFSGTDPKCVPLCKIPAVENGAYLTKSRTDGMDPQEGEQIVLECNQGFKLSNGNSSRICQANHIWTEKAAACTDTHTSIGTLAGIGGGSGAIVVAIVVIVVVALVLFRRRKRHVRSPTVKRKHSIDYYTTNTMMTIDAEPGNEYSYINDAEVEVNIDEDHVYCTVEPKEEPEYYSFTPERLPETAIRVSELVNVILAKDADLSLLTEQFESFPKGMTANHNSATKTENRGKNEYRDMYAYDKTRVVLQHGNLKSETDYINACYINVFGLSKRYIAAQAPFELTVNDFWRMIWQTQVSKIVVLAKLKEEENVKCEQYWPTKGTEVFGTVKVTLKKIEQFSDFIVRTIVISKDDSPNRTVTQFHFTAWPDRGVPNYASSLNHFRQKAMNAKTDTTGPIVVHCSAGVGRTGTFIALDILVEQGKRLGYVDVKGCVQTLRKQRVMMVQTLEQYTFVHMALTEALMLSPFVLPAASFISTYKDALEIDPETRERRLDSEFEMLRKMSPAAEESQYINAMEIRNRRKNRYPDILPVEEFMPSLKDESGVSYINAVFLPSYRTKNAFIITQTPLEDTQAEFWRVVFDHNVHTIVMMNSVSELQAKEIYWPQGEDPLTHDNLKICLIESEVQESHNILTMEVTVSNKKRKIKLFQYCYQATDDEFPGTPESFLTLMELVQYWQQQTSNNPVVVHCMNGVDKSGLYCVISSVIERLKIEQDVAISQTIEVMRNCREQLIPSVDQFQFCHDVVLAYINQFETYYNLTQNLPS